MVNKKIRVIVIGGGFSNERAVSLNSAKQVVAHLPQSRYQVVFFNLPAQPKKAIAALVKYPWQRNDIAFLALHGQGGEDGCIQQILEAMGVRYTGSGALVSAFAFDKVKTNELLAVNKIINLPKTLVYSAGQLPSINFLTKEVKQKIGYPCIVKPNAGGSSIGITLVNQPKELAKAVNIAFKEDKVIMIQQYIQGRELTCGILGNSGLALSALPVIEIISAHTLFDYSAKYSGESQELCPAPIAKKLADLVKKISLEIHQALGCRGLTRSDFILDKNGKLYFLEINTIPGLTSESLCPKEAKALGWSFGEFLAKQVQLAFQ